jgi:hypothetical protein
MTLFSEPAVAIADKLFMLSGELSADMPDGVTDAGQIVVDVAQLRALEELARALDGAAGGARRYVGVRMDRW